LKQSCQSFRAPKLKKFARGLMIFLKTKLDQSRREIAEGSYTTRQPK
jgi:hypothetical protein